MNMTESEKYLLKMYLLRVGGRRSGMTVVESGMLASECLRESNSVVT